MKTNLLSVLVTVVLLVIGVKASEIVVKNSAPFSFPLTVGTVINKRAFARQASFGVVYRTAGSKLLDLSWSLPDNGKKGTITLFSLRGAIVRTFPIDATSGSIRLNVSESHLVNGIYVARLSSGSMDKNHKIVIY